MLIASLIESPHCYNADVAETQYPVSVLSGFVWQRRCQLRLARRPTTDRVAAHRKSGRRAALIRYL
jgi:hypothetical protein